MTRGLLCRQAAIGWKPALEAMARFLLADTLDENAIRRSRGIAREVSMNIGFVGFGEAGSAIAKGLVSSGVENVYAYDIAPHSAAQRDAMARRAEEAGVTIAESLQDLAGQSDIILSTVVSTVARKVAEEITPHLRPDHYYVDLNSTSPAVDPFFKLLGWDIGNEKGYAEAYKDVIHEDPIKIGGATKAPDYCFRTGGTCKFFLEAKVPRSASSGRRWARNRPCGWKHRCSRRPPLNRIQD